MVRRGVEVVRRRVVAVTRAGVVALRLEVAGVMQGLGRVVPAMQVAAELAMWPGVVVPRGMAGVQGLLDVRPTTPRRVDRG